MALTLIDNFNDNSIDGAIWTEVDTGTNVNEQNQRLETVGNNNWNVNGVICKSQQLSQANGVYFEHETWSNTGNTYFMSGVQLASNALDWQKGIWLFFNADQNLYVLEDGSQTDTGYNFVDQVEYTVKFLCTGSGAVSIYIDGGAFSDQKIYDATCNAANLNFFAFQVYSANMNYIDDVYYESGSAVGGARLLDGKMGSKLLLGKV